MPRSTNPRLLSFAAACALAVTATPADAQSSPRPLTPQDYGQWERLGAFELDPNGRWLVAAISLVDGDRSLQLHRADGSDDALTLDFGHTPDFSADGRWLLYRKGVSAEEAEEASERIEDRLGLVDLETLHDSVHFAIRDAVFRDDGRWIAALGIAPSDSVGADLMVLDPDSGIRTLIGNVGEFAWQEDGQMLAATLKTAWGSANGVILLDPEAGVLRTLESGDTDYTGLTWHEGSSRLAVLRAVEDDSREEASHDVLVWDDVTTGAEARTLRTLERPELGLDFRVTPFAGLEFSEDGRMVFVGVRPWEQAPDAEVDDEAGEAATEGEPGDDPESDDSQDEVEPADVQVWHWDDDQILRAQEYGAARFSRQTMLAAWHLDRDAFVVLGDDVDEPVTLLAHGRWGTVPDYDPYRFERRFGAGTADWYRVDTRTGERALIRAGLEFGVQSHEELDRLLVYAEDRWHAVDAESLESIELAGGRSFTRGLADYDYPGPRPSWGVGGWSSDGSAAYLYDRHDVWRADLHTGDATRLTSGSVSGERLRLVNLDPEQSRFGPALVTDADDLVLSAFHLRTKASGYLGIDADGNERWSMRRDARVAGLVRSANGERTAFRAERWDDSPDVFVASGDLGGATQVSQTNSFQPDFTWGQAELLDYTTDAGHEMQAILVYPADFEPGRTYPLILYQYERLSDNLHAYNPPARRQYYNYQVWSQNGYFVLMPDIVYEPGRPGPSALDAVGHALDAAVATGHVDASAMGLIGHSWGGYQASYLPTRTNRFAASVAGAAITNFMSFMGAVHWNGGLPETGHWETGQARMAVPYWEDMEGHLESSPANFIADLETPMLLMHGDADGVVDFYQGLEFYNYARRAGKEVVLLVYPGADHGLSEERQQVDYHDRILEWFGHYLKGEPAPRWITDGESWPERAKRIGG